jgi:alpha-galactosidase
MFDGVPSSTLLQSWARADTMDTSDPNVTRRTINWIQPTGAAHRLRVTCEVVEYLDIPATDWTIWFKNLGDEASPLLSGVLALDAWIEKSTEESFIVHTIEGCKSDHDDQETPPRLDFQPFEVAVEPSGSWRVFSTDGGRSTSYVLADTNSDVLGGGWPYYNIELRPTTGEGQHGVIVALGWPGQWTVEFRRADDETGVHLLAGMSSNFSGTYSHIEDSGLTETILEPGEEIRTPRAVLQYWACPDWIGAQNNWRRWMRAHNMPRPLGVLPDVANPTGIHGYFDQQHSSAADDDNALDLYSAAGLIGRTMSFDWWWRDAGWFPGAAWRDTGTWKPDPTRYPSPTAGDLDGLSPIFDRVHDTYGMRTVLWFDPEVVQGETTELWDKHGSWLIGPSDNQKLLDFGLDAARAWVIDRVDDLIELNGVDALWQDNNFHQNDGSKPYGPQPFWSDASNRLGMTQIKHVMGLMAYCDEVLSRNPGTVISFVGHRLDLELLRRSVPMFRSDGALSRVGQGAAHGAVLEQNHSYGLALWLPYSGAAAPPGGDGLDHFYLLRSGFAATFLNSIDPRPGHVPGQSAFEAVRSANYEWRMVADNFVYGDFHPLTDYSTASDAWVAWQYNSYQLGEGVVQAFRRPGNGQPTLSVALRGLDTRPGVEYELEDYNAGTLSIIAGRTLENATIALRAGTATNLRYRKRIDHATLLAAAQPVGWWRLGESSGSVAADSSGHGNAGTIYLAGTTLGSAGAIGGDSDGAIEFDNTGSDHNSYIDLGNPQELQIDAGSVETWVKTTNTETDGQAVAIKWGAYGIFLSEGLPGVFDWSTLTYHGSTGEAAFVADGDWHHIVLTFRSGVTNGTRIYVDGELVLTATITVLDQTHDALIAAGNHPATTNWYTGTIDEVAFFQDVLSTAQVRRSYEVGAPNPPFARTVANEQPVGWWRLGESSGSVAADSSGHGNAGTIYLAGTTLGSAGAIGGDSDGAIEFDNTGSDHNSYIDLGNPQELQIDAGSVETWVKTTNTETDGQAVAIKWGAYGIFLSEGLPGVFDWSTLTYHGSTGEAAFVADGDWHHIVLTFRSGVTNGTRIYVDGELVLTATITVLDQTHDALIAAGNHPATTNWYTGTIDEVAFFQDVLSAAQIARHWHAGTQA